MRKKIFITTLIVTITILVYLCVSLMMSPNGKLTLNEMKAYFRNTVHLNLQLNVNEISEIQIGGAASLSVYDSFEPDCAIYKIKENIELITQYLNSLELAESNKEELPNISCDSFIQYYDINGNLTENLLIYGEIFIENVNDKKIYRIKNTNLDIIDGLKKVGF